MTLLRLEDVVETLTAYNGRVVPAAKALCVPLHTLRSFIDAHAEAQAPCRNRDIEIVDLARDNVLAALDSAVSTLTAKERADLGKWVLSNAASDVYSPKNIVDLNAKKAADLTNEELVAIINSNTDMRSMLEAALNGDSAGSV